MCHEDSSDDDSVGRKRSPVARGMEGRTDNAVKARYTLLERKGEEKGAGMGIRKASPKPEREVAPFGRDSCGKVIRVQGGGCSYGTGGAEQMARHKASKHEDAPKGAEQRTDSGKETHKDAKHGDDEDRDKAAKHGPKPSPAPLDRNK